MNKFILTSLLFLFSLFSFGQKRHNVYFLKDNGEHVKTKDSADFIRIVWEPDSGSVLYNVQEFYKNNNLKRLGTSSSIDPLRMEGHSILYYPNGHKHIIADYKNNLLEGNYYEYFPNGHLFCYKQYTSPGNVFGADQYKIISVFDSLGNEIVTQGNGYYKGYDNDFKSVTEEGPLKNGQPEGQWKGTNPGMKFSFEETYKDGKFIEGSGTDSLGRVIHYQQKLTQPEFPGGLEQLYAFLARKIIYPDYAKAHNIQGRVILEFMVEKNGEIRNVKILRSVYKDIDEEAVRALMLAPKWNPGLAHGMPVRVSYALPIMFTLTP
jgi:TonB family protein